MKFFNLIAYPAFSSRLTKSPHVAIKRTVFQCPFEVTHFQTTFVLLRWKKTDLRTRTTEKDECAQARFPGLSRISELLGTFQASWGTLQELNKSRKGPANRGREAHLRFSCLSSSQVSEHTIIWKAHSFEKGGGVEGWKPNLGKHKRSWVATVEKFSQTGKLVWDW